MAITLDHVVSLLQATILHPLRSLLFAGIAFLLQSWEIHSGSVHLDQAFETVRRLVPLNLALGCVAFSWILHLNRTLSRNALNPSPRIPCDWVNEIVVVTGGSGGIGREIVSQLEELSATVVLLDTSPPTFPIGERTHYFKADVSNLTSLLNVRKEISAKLGSPTMIVSNAGVLKANTVINMSEDDIRTTFDVTILGFVFCVKAFLPSMIAANRGHIVAVSSVTAHSPAATIGCYSASKAALLSVVEGVQTELKHKHGNPRVKVSAVIPGPVKTKMHADFALTVNEAVMPYLEPSRVAKTVCKILSEGESQMIMTPVISNVSPILHIMPHWIRIAAQDLGAKAMRHQNNDTKPSLPC